MTEDRLVIEFETDGAPNFFAETPDPVRLARRLTRLAAWLIENPSAAGCIAGTCEKHGHHPRAAGLHPTLQFAPGPRRRRRLGP